jgi:hypothetical protein
MKNPQSLLLTLFIALLSMSLSAQVSYKGAIDKYPVEMLVEIYSDGPANATYCYTNFDTPIPLSGNFKNGTLTLYEKDSRKVKIAVISFDNFNEKETTHTGTWKSLQNGKTFTITISKDFTPGDAAATWATKEMMQPVSAKDKYFKLVLSKTKENPSPRVTAIKIYAKKTDVLLQELPVECQLWGIQNVDVGDFNFDGVEDFSVFESSYAGANTSSLYFLYDPATGKYFNSGFEGVSLEFDKKTKTVVENNVCCGGQYTKTYYKIVNNKMVATKH